MVSRSSRIVHALALALSIAACNAIVGIEDPIEVQPSSQQSSHTCLLNSDCPDSSQVCLFETCSPPCEADRDCDPGARCLNTDVGRACVISSSASCSEQTECPDGSVCTGGACRNRCGGCLDDQECDADGACHGTGVHDGPSGGGNGGNGGSGGSGGAGGTGGTQVVGAAGSAAGSPDGGQSGAAGAGPIDMVCKPGFKHCAELVIETCIDDQWTATGDCPYACKDGACVGECVPDTVGCEGTRPESCLADATWDVGAACPKVCEKGMCVERCTQDALKCEAGDLKRCDANGAWILEQECAVDCLNEQCTECAPPSEKCESNQHRTCTPEGTWGAPFTCQFMCVGNDCGVCQPNAQPTTCLNNAPQYCDETGNWKPAAGACSGATPLCLNGACVACNPGASECVDANTPRSCQPSGSWTNGTDCSGATPACLAGACVACSPGAVGCLDANTPRSCQPNGTWTNGTDCSGAAPVCLAGACVACSPGAVDCLDTNTPRSCQPNGTWTNGTDCSGATPACLAGACVTCAPGAVDCLDANTPRSCQPSGSWTNGTDCSGATPACLAGACVTCSPGAVDCLDANTPRSCQPNGTWTNSTDCSGTTPACLAGACVECTPNATPTHCASACTKSRQYCSPQGAWTDYVAACTGADICSGGACGLGVEEPVGQYIQLPSFIDGVADYLLANRIQAPCGADLLRLGARFKTASGSVRFALYTDVGGAPGNIVAGTGSVAVAAGVTEASATSVKLTAGSYYWVVMNLGSQTAAPYYQDAVSPAPTRYAAYAFTNAAFPPTTFPTPDTLPHLYDLYAIVRRNP